MTSQALDGRRIPDVDLRRRFAVVEVFEGGEGWCGLVSAEDGGRAVLKVSSRRENAHEASLLASLDHPRVPRVLEAGRTASGHGYVLREHVPGTPLDREMPLDEAAAVSLATDLLEVLVYVHLRGVLHLDIKPSNVLRRERHGRFEHVLLDFGLGARAGEPSRGSTPLYAAPEVRAGLPVDERTDLFSLGALLAVACRRSPAPVAMRRFLAAFPREPFLAAAGIHESELPARLRPVVQRLVARNPAERYGDAQEALEALAGGTGRPPISALRPDPIALRGELVQRAVATIAEGQDLVLRGGGPEDRRLLALHAASLLSGVRCVRDDGTACVLERGGTGDLAVELPDLGPTELATHLRTSTMLDEVAAARAADELLRTGPRSVDAVARRLEELVEAGRIVPDGARWAWPEASAGRATLAAGGEVGENPTAVAQAAARGDVEGAVRAVRRALRRPRGRQREPALRAALAGGLLRAGLPRRALPLTHDLPVHRARALLDAGEVAAAADTAERLERTDPRRARSTRSEMERLLASIDYARGRLDRAERRLRARRRRTPADRCTLGLVLVALGRPQEAIAQLDAVVADVDRDREPFLVAAALTNRAQAHRHEGDLQAAERDHREALALYRRLGHVRYAAAAEANLGVLAKDRGELDRAREHLRRARASMRHVGDRLAATQIEVSLANVALEGGDAATAARRYQAAIEELTRLGAVRELDLYRAWLARARAASGDPSAAEEILAAIGEGRDERTRAAVALAREVIEQARAGPGATGREARPAPAPRNDPPAEGKDLLRAVLSINRKLAGEVDLGRAMEHLLEIAVALAGARSGSLLVARPDGPRLEVRTPRDRPLSAFSRSMLNRALHEGRILTAEDAIADRGLAEMPSVRGLQWRSAMFVPFSTPSGVGGAIHVEHPERSGVFGEEEKSHLEILADQAAIAVERLLQEERLAAELERSRRAQNAGSRRTHGSGARMIGRSAPMRALRARIERLADADLPILVAGETGTGKELVARELHARGGRATAPFVAESCAAIPPELLESELFGHVRGAFTGADQDRAGLLELASGGTLFLDEIGEMPLALQPKLLRVLEERRVRRLGEGQARPVGFRLVAATHRDLRAMVAEGSFRADLYYRLAGAEIVVPPLRARGEDVVLLAEEFLARLGREHRREVVFSGRALEELTAYDWPGNVRELEHVVARAFLLAEGDVIESLQLPAPATDGEDHLWPAIPLREAERRTIRAALDQTGGDKSAAARLLGISRAALYAKLERLGIPKA